MRLRRMAAGFVVLAAVGTAPLLLAEPATACSCGLQAVADTLAAGSSVAVVTRSDHGAGSRATLTVEAEAGPDLPATLTTSVGNSGASCGFSLRPGHVAAVIVDRRGTGWRVNSCDVTGPAEALAHIRGAPKPAAGGPAVAVASGDFGGSRLAGLDAEGRVVAWDGQSGTGSLAAVCPGGDTVVDAGRGRDGNGQLSVHDSATLSPRRVIDLPRFRIAEHAALRCADPRGGRVEILTSASRSHGQLVTVSGTDVTRVRLDPLESAAAVGDGFVAVTEKSPTLVRIRTDGSRERLTELPHGGALTLAPDERTVLVSGAVGGAQVFRTVDLDSGATLGAWTAPVPFTAGATWIDAHTLAIRQAFEREHPPEQLLLFDRSLRETGRQALAPSAFTFRSGSVAGAIVTFEGPRVTVAPGSPDPLVVAELRLARAQGIVGIPGRSFNVDPAAVPAEPLGALFDIEERPTYRGPVLAVLAAVIITALLIRRHRARP